MKDEMRAMRRVLTPKREQVVPVVVVQHIKIEMSFAEVIFLCLKVIVACILLFPLIGVILWLAVILIGVFGIPLLF